MDGVARGARGQLSPDDVDPLVFQHVRCGAALQHLPHLGVALERQLAAEKDAQQLEHLAVARMAVARMAVARMAVTG